MRLPLDIDLFANRRAAQLPDLLTEKVVLKIPGLANRREDPPCDNLIGINGELSVKPNISPTG
jgi:hypothetical protein